MAGVQLMGINYDVFLRSYMSIFNVWCPSFPKFFHRTKIFCEK